MSNIKKQYQKKDIIHMGTITSCHKNIIDNYYYPSGPIFSLKKEKTFEMVNHLRGENKWNVESRDSENYPLSIDTLLFDMKLLSYEIYSENFIYFFDVVEMHHYSRLDYYNDFPLFHHIVLKAVSKVTGIEVFTMVLGYETNRLICEHYPQFSLNPEDFQIDANNYDLFFSRESIKDLFSFDFLKFNYYISKINIEDYVFNFSEISEGIEDIGFVPFNMIMR